MITFKQHKVSTVLRIVRMMNTPQTTKYIRLKLMPATLIFEVLKLRDMNSLIIKIARQLLLLIKR